MFKHHLIFFGPNVNDRFKVIINSFKDLFDIEVTKDIKIRMQVVYSFISYFVSIMIYLTISLGIFAFPSARTILHRFKTRFNDLF
jgi:hypothetical protein